MRPRGNPRGDPTCCAAAMGARCRFNAATREPAWRPVRSRSESGQTTDASMRPRGNPRGDHRGRRIARCVHQQASMRPRGNPRGDLAIALKTAGKSRKLQCGHAGTRVETQTRGQQDPREGCRASMRPRGNPRGDPACQGLQKQGMHRFNAATREPAWRPRQSLADQCRLHAASMRPRGNPRGDPAVLDTNGSMEYGFNAATREPAWRPEMIKADPDVATELQCGHAGTRVETCQPSSARARQ